jgi:hypothetical protein
MARLSKTGRNHEGLHLPMLGRVSSVALLVPHNPRILFLRTWLAGTQRTPQNWLVADSAPFL